MSTGHCANLTGKESFVFNMRFEDYAMSKIGGKIHNNILNSSSQQVRFLLNMMLVLREKVHKQRMYILHITKADWTKTAQTSLILACSSSGVSYFCNANEKN